MLNSTTRFPRGVQSVTQHYGEDSVTGIPTSENGAIVWTEWLLLELNKSITNSNSVNKLRILFMGCKIL